MRPIRVLVVDDSAFMRHALSRLLTEAGDIEVVGTAGDGMQALAAVVNLRPDVVTLDVEMPVLDGLETLRRLMRENPTRVVMLSSLTSHGAAVTLDALEAGAIDFVPKPSGSLSIDMARVRDELLAKIRAAAAIPESAFLAHRLAVRARAPQFEQRSTIRPMGTASAGPAPASAPASAPLVSPGVGPVGRPAGLAPTAAPAPMALAAARLEPARRLVVIASSTGGPGALGEVARGLPASLGAAMLIVQHMPPHFTASLAERLNATCAMPVREAAAGDVVAADTILIAPGGSHMLTSTRGRVELAALPPVNGLRPAADVTLQAIAPNWRDRVLLVVLTGMGSDALQGARAIRAYGGTVYAQDEATSVVYGMPAAVKNAGLVAKVLPLPDVAAAIAAWCRTAAAAADATPRPATAGGPTGLAAAR